jgi:site-specific recombinase XerD
MRDINQFSEWLSLRGEKGLGDISQRDIEEYLGKLKNAGKSSATLSRCAASLKCFFTAAVEAGLTKKNPVSKVIWTSSQKAAADTYQQGGRAVSRTA